ncbi:MAG: hypothetical protein A2092_01135 [Rhodobacteraceae bacterium GWE1_64_9]|nr:MAG: hypothetical protein A2092_01135 [Rhodobacteraceae bacterium GWE1_64_9]
MNGRLADGHPFRLLNLLDDFNREGLGIREAPGGCQEMRARRDHPRLEPRRIGDGDRATSMI